MKSPKLASGLLALALALFGPSSAVAAPKTSRTFAVMRFNGKEIHNGRVDPIVNPNDFSPHVHTVQGSTGFGPSANGESLRAANCTNSKLKGDMSNYWFPRMYFRDPSSGEIEAVPMFYTNVYYFFEPTDDELTAFPLGLSMLSGNVSLRTPPTSRSGAQVLDPKDGEIQPVGFTCPRNSYSPPSWPADSDGETVGIQDPNNQGQGVGFPNQNCDGYASPMRADIHFPSCYNPEAGVASHKENMAWPTSGNGATAEARASGRANCPEGWVHVPHLFLEVYWDTASFADRWTPGGNSQPFVLSNGDATGYSLHADFMSGWDETLLQNIIDNCNAGHQGMEYCPGVADQVNTEECSVPPFIDEDVDGPFQSLPGGQEITGWSYGSGSGSGSGSKSSASAVSSSSASQTATYKVYEAKASVSSSSSTPAPVVPVPTSSVSSPAEYAAPVSAVTSSSSSSSSSSAAPLPPSSPPPALSSSSSSSSLPPAITPLPAQTTPCKTPVVHTVWETVTEYVDADPTAVPVQTPSYGRRHLVRHRGRSHRF